MKSDVERFLWNFLAFATAPLPINTSGSGEAESALRCQALNATACPAGMVCAGSRSLPA